MGWQHVVARELTIALFPFCTSGHTFIEITWETSCHIFRNANIWLGTRRKICYFCYKNKSQKIPRQAHACREEIGVICQQLQQPAKTQLLQITKHFLLLEGHLKERSCDCSYVRKQPTQGKTAQGNKWSYLEGNEYRAPTRKSHLNLLSYCSRNLLVFLRFKKEAFNNFSHPLYHSVTPLGRRDDCVRAKATHQVMHLNPTDHLYENSSWELLLAWPALIACQHALMAIFLTHFDDYFYLSSFRVPTACLPGCFLIQ